MSPRPSDEEVNELFNAATAFVQTSVHEGFCLPVLESMATGGAVVCTDAHGNRDFCVDGENCLMRRLRARGGRRRGCGALLADPGLRARLGAAGVRTAQRYGWPVRIDALEAFLEDVAPGRGRIPLPALQIFGDPWGGPVEHPEAEHEHRPARSRSGSAARCGPPSREAALGAAWVTHACRNCWKTTASGFSM